MQASTLERPEESSPVDLLLGQSDRSTQNLTVPGFIDPDRHQDGHVNHAAALSDLLIAGIEEHVGEGPQGAIAPGREALVEQLRRAADLHGRDLDAAELLGDFRHLARGDALDVHLGHRQAQGPL